MFFLNFKSILLFIGIFSIGWCKEEFVLVEDLLIVIRSIRNNPGILMQILPQLNEDCSEQLMQISLLLRKKSVPFWLTRMLDSSAKLQSGLLQGTLYNLGSYDECLAVNGSSDGIQIKGQHCLVKIPLQLLLNSRVNESLLERANINWGLCLPDKCRLSDVESFLAFFKDSAHSLTHIKGGTCRTLETDNPPLNALDICFITFLSLILVLMVLSTLYDYLVVDIEKGKRLFCCFSVISNGKMLFSTSDSSDRISCLSGIRTLSMMWIIFAHLYSLSIQLSPISNPDYVIENLRSFSTSYIRSATVAVDSFFLVSGIVMVFAYFKITQLEDKKFNIFYYYLHRYLRLTPSLAVMVLFDMTLARHLVSGPLAFSVNRYLEASCQEYWWSTLTYIQNIYNPQRMCVSQSWFLGVDFQLFLISPLILLPLKKHRRLTIGFIVVLIAISMSYSFAIAYIYELTGLMEPAQGKMERHYYKLYYVQPHTRAPTWLIGCIVGFYIFEYKMVVKNYSINKNLNLWLWAASCLVLLFVAFYFLDGDNNDRVAMSLYITFIRSVWALALSWIIFSCVMGYGGFLNKFLSMPLFQILGKLTYSLYIVHYSYMVMILASKKDSALLSQISKSFEFWSIYIPIFFISIVWTLAFESPTIALEKIQISVGSRKKSTRNDEETESPKMGPETSNVNIDNGCECTRAIQIAKM